MKKTLAIVLSVLLCFMLVGCGAEKAKNGEYKAEFDEAYAKDKGHGWQEYLIVTYTDGVITKAEYDAVYVSGDGFEAGTKKSSLSAEEYGMDIGPDVWIPILSANILAGGSSDKVDGVAGATGSSDNAIKLLAAIEKEGKAGKTVVIKE